MDKHAGKRQQTPHFPPKNNNHNKHHHGLPPAKRPRPPATSEGVANKRRITSSSRVDDIRLVLESTATDDELAVKVDRVKAELQAVDGALGDEGSSYLGIVDRGELEKRRQLLEKRHKLLKEERELVQTLRVQLAEEERTGTQRTGPRAPSSPAPRRSSSNNDNTAAAPPQQPSPSLRIQTPASPTSPPATKRTFSYPPLSPPAASGADASSIGDFLKRNSAAVGKKLAGAAASRPEAAKLATAASSAKSPR